MFRNIFHKDKSTETSKKLEPVAEPEMVIEPKPIAKTKSAVAIVPIFSWRTVLVIVIGLIIGVLLALGYWIISPSFSSAPETTYAAPTDEVGTGLIGLLGLAPSGPYESKVRVQVVSPGSEYIPLMNLQQMGEYYSAKASSLPFLEFLNKRLAEQMPGYTYDVDQLSWMITSEYDLNSELPAIKVTVVGETKEEAIGVAGLITQNFRDFLTSEEQSKRQKQYDTILKEIDGVKEALYDAQTELNALQMNEILNTNASYISLRAKVDALQQMLDAQVIQLASQAIDETDIYTEYDATLQQMAIVTTELDKANRELEALLPAETGSDSKEVSIITLNAKISALQGELDRAMTGYTQSEGNTQVRYIGLAEMIANGDTTGAYITLSEKVNTISQALANAQKELAAFQRQSTELTMSLTYQLAQIKIDTLSVQLLALKEKASGLYQQIVASEQGNGQPDLQTVFEKTSAALAEAKIELDNLEYDLGYDRLAIDLDYKIAEDKVINLNTRLEDLTEQLGLLVGGNVESSETDYLVAGNPTTPSPVLPVRGRASNVLLLGAIAGIVIAWGALNFRWIVKALFSSNTDKSGGDGGGE